MLREQRLDDPPLDPDSAPVNQPDLAKTALVGGDEIFLDDGGDVPRRKGVEIERVLDRNADEFVVGIQRSRRVRAGCRS